MEPLVIIAIILTIILWAWALIDIAKTRRQNPSQKSLWFLLIIVFPILGSILYFQFKGGVPRRQFDPKFH